MSRLAELQQRFQQCLLKPPKDLARPWVSTGGRATPERQLAVYVHAYSARLKEALVSDYPALHRSIGDEAFYRLAQAYLEAHPSLSASLRHFGARLAAFIADEPAYRRLPWLAELSRFEWALGQAFDAADDPVVLIDDMATIAPPDWPDMAVAIHPSVQRLDLRWNTAGMWASLTAERPTPVTATEGSAVPWLVWREQLTTRFRSLEPDECAAFDCLCDGGSLGDVCERLTAFIAAEAVPLRAASLLKAWIGHGLIGAVRTAHRDATHRPTPSAYAIQSPDRRDTGRNISPR
jgi:hypothetical protein